ncbi:MAG: Ig-like domain-containing protein, partial [Anaerovoracaceae bacterium]
DLTEGEVIPLRARVIPENATNKALVWTSGNNAIATVDSLGNVTGVKSGITVIKATSLEGATALSQGDTLVPQTGAKQASAVITVTKSSSITGITINKDKLVQNIEDTEKLVATIMPEGVPNRGITWNSSNPAIATVSSTGDVTAMASGTTTIRATSVLGGYSVSATIEVVPKRSVTSVKLSENTVTLSPSETKRITATVLPSDAINKNVTFTSSNPAIATVDNTGLITAIQKGTATITITTVDGNRKDTAIVSVGTRVSSISLDKTNIELAAGTSEKVTGTVLPENAINKEIEFSSNNAEIAQVDKDGNIAAMAVGSTIIKATTKDGGKTAEAIVTVKKSVAQINLSEYYKAMSVGETSQIIASIQPLDAFNSNLTWESSDETIAKVDNSGAIEAKTNGVAIVSVNPSGSNLKAYSVISVSQPITKITLDTESLELDIGQKKTFVAAIEPANATNRNLIWTSSNTESLVVDQFGQVEAKAAGLSTITAKTPDNQVSARALVKVTTLKAVTSLELSEKDIKLKIGEQKDLGVTILPEDASNKSVIWSSSNENIISVDSTGTITALSGGSAIITVRSTYGNIVDTALVSVDKNIPVENIYFDSPTMAITETQEAKGNLVIMPEDASNKKIFWSTDNETIASVSSEGVITGNARG